MEKQCPICNKPVDESIIKTCEDAQEWVMKMIKRDHPGWIATDGSCPQCLDYYEKLGKKSAD